ncbi:2-hydroxyacid dehydrogenase [Mesorhizobium sp. SB112]|uniref:2-hydroxyacid dehydrogenase n=1 Tax=Mesorhizobium sp. SB112 TaxID=3151853 RepID=UPI003267ED61
MNIFLVGEAGNHRTKLLEALAEPIQIQELPREASHSDQWDGALAPDDIVISLRLKRATGKLPPFRLLHIPGAGTDGIDLNSLDPHVTVCNVYEHEIPIAEFVIGQILNWEIRFEELRQSMSVENWSDVYRSRFPHGELFGKTVGIIGFGRIGRAIASRAKSFGVKIIALDVFDPGDGLADNVLKPAQLAEFLPQTDYCVVTCPLSAATRGMIARAELALMKKTAVLINVSRAELVEERALFEALESTVIGGAVLDVWYRYPTGGDDKVPPSDFDFTTLPNAVCTPHSSAWTTALPKRRYGMIAENINRLRRGEPLVNVVRAGVAAHLA